MTSDLGPEELAALTAATSRPDGRGQLLEAIVDLCETAGGAKTERGQEVLESIFLDLVSHAEREVRIRLSGRLASAPWAPSGLINALALDDIDIARPVIARSPVLKDRDLIFLLAAATLDHQIEVARRPGLGSDVVEAIVDHADPIVMTALAGNATANVSAPSLSRLVALSERLVSLRAPLARHPRLNPALAGRLYAWVGAALKTELESRFAVDKAAFASAIEEAVGKAVAGAPAPAARVGDAHDPLSVEQRLVAKLHASGQLRPGFLMRALRQSKLSLFAAGLASLAGEPLELISQALNADDPGRLASLATAVGIDRSVFPTLVGFVRSLNMGRPGGGPEAVADALTVQDGDEDLRRFRAAFAPGDAREI